MNDPLDELLRFLRENGVGPWVVDSMGCSVRVQDWADQFVYELSEFLSDDAIENSDRLQSLRELLAEKPRKLIAVDKVLEVIDLIR